MSLTNREKVLFIVNPTSGKMTIKNEFFKVIKLFSDSGFEPTVLTTTKAGDATQFAKEYGPNFDRIISCGGDGTLNEIVTGIMELKPEARRPLGFIPAGTTNDLADTLRIPKNPMDAAKAIIDNPALPNDVGVFNNTRYFNYIASCGAFTSTSYATPQNLKNSLGHMAYILEGIKSLNEIKPVYMKIESEELNIDGEFVFAGVTNALSVAGIYKFDPRHVDLSDGTFEVILIRMPKNTTDIVDIFVQLANLDNSENQVIFFHTKNVTITCEEPVKWTVDGEFGGKLDKVNIKNNPGAINIFKPKPQEKKEEKK
ncbi:MAG: diacylglycerol kinase family lipid kinase [Ruminococcaceae bacterium]|nr:diacylglycerol kinase family lipid kinase [Oscillospiraceae bacterium]